MSASHTDLSVVTKVVAGAAAGDVTVTGITIRDKLKAVVGFTLSEGAPNTINVLDLTDEFSISAADTINNDGGTSSANGILFVTYIAADPLGGDLNRS